MVMHSRRPAATLAAIFVAMLGAAACGSGTPPGLDASLARFTVVDSGADTTIGALRYNVRTRARGTLLELQVSVANVGTQAVRVRWGTCSIGPQLYTTAARSGTPVFDWLKRPSPDPATGARWTCPTDLSFEDLFPHDTIAPAELLLQIDALKIAGDSLPDGRYHLSAKTMLLDRPTDVVPLRAGVVDLIR